MHPLTGRELRRFEAPLPADLRAVLAALRAARATRAPQPRAHAAARHGRGGDEVGRARADWPAPPGVRAASRCAAAASAQGRYDSLNLGAHVGDRCRRRWRRIAARVAPAAQAARPSRSGCSRCTAPRSSMPTEASGGGAASPPPRGCRHCAPPRHGARGAGGRLPAGAARRARWQRRSAVAHAGWRGLAAGVLEAAVRGARRRRANSCRHGSGRPSARRISRSARRCARHSARTTAQARRGIRAQCSAAAGSATCAALARQRLSRARRALDPWRRRAAPTREPSVLFLPPRSDHRPHGGADLAPRTETAAARAA